MELVTSGYKELINKKLRRLTENLKSQSLHLSPGDSLMPRIYFVSQRKSSEKIEKVNTFLTP